MSPESAQPFEISETDRVTVYGAKNFPEVAGLLPDSAFLAEDDGRFPADVVLLFVASAADLAHDLAKAAAAVEPGGSLWVCYPTADVDGGAPDLNRDTVASLVETNDWEPVGDAVINSEWSAVRGRPAGK
ncbi:MULTISPECIES: hypothetical protein [unclassified Arthrobacter]|uniref:hypothetical protein n=1 Tax=unclassified Arthrobacter TaxID=235627 RepID=UPI001D1381DD|nr:MULTISPECIES: hypothetical protein [unclassified Arthrobacter]MCC3291744.1 hypothetical protein [Arthrobacter sp. zg-Y1110]MCC3302121.1 hypothetical protein [Arthrobacter sp. zg-Y895]UWX85584.1 hypothetical protein N2K99_03230 [Arthrobacter sp. zg-Y1110]